MAWNYVDAIYSPWQGNFRLEVRFYTGDQNIEANTTQVLAEVYLQSQPGWFVDASFTGQALASTWGGAATKQHYNPGGATTLFTSYSRTITHNADGTKSINVGGSLKANNVIAFDQAISQWFLLPTIPRATTPTLSGGGGFTTGAARTISLPRASTNFTHDVTYSFRGLTGTIATGAGVTATWTPPHDLMEALTNGTAANVTITVVTKQGSTVIGTRSAQFSLTAAASIVPTVSQVLWDDNNPTVKANIGAFVQGLSLISGTVNATGVYGSTITERRLRVGSTIVPEGTPIQIAGHGTVTAQGEAIDSRGRLGTLAASFGVLQYEPPRLGANGWQIRRANSAGAPDDNGQHLRLDLHALVNSLEVAGVEKNALTVTVRTRPVGGSWTNRNTISPGLSYNSNVLITGGAVFLTSQSYEVEVTLTDRTGSEPTRMSTTVATAAVTLDLNGNAVGVGKYHELGMLDVGGDIYANGLRVITTADTATESVAGLVERATAAEVNAGTDTTRYVSPARMRNATYRAWAEAAGRFIYSSAVNNGTGVTLNVTLPTGRFTDPPVVVPAVRNSSRLQAAIIAPETTTGFSVRLDNFSGGTAGASGVHWHAIQMTSGSAEG